MKGLKGLFALFLVMFVTLGSVPQAQITQDITRRDLSDGTAYFTMAGKCSSTATLTSQEFYMPEFNTESYYTYPPQCALLLSGGTASTQKVTVQILGTNIEGGTHAVFDTLFFKDSSTTEINKTNNFNGKKYLKLRVKVIGEAGNVNTTFKLTIYAYRRNFWKSPLTK